jgi:type IV pilus assembly protein PilA
MRTVRGFTLIELMIAVAIVGILAATALPAYQQYTVRAKLSEVILAVSGCRTSITETYQSVATSPGANNWGCEEGVSSRYVLGIATDEHGKVSATLRGLSADMNGKVLTLVPLVDATTAAQAPDDMGARLYGWRCGSPADGTDVELSYLPGSCRGR